jgi:peptidoglycan/LPS O-acetylase OafA/YrhL
VSSLAIEPRAAHAAHFRPDIQGLRALAVSLVVLAHAGVAELPGGFVGVDVFFVLSGFLITGLLVREADENGRIDIGDFYAKRARRILPAAAVTLIATGLATHFLLNFVRAKDVFGDILWSGLFAANVRFAQSETDYFARDEPPSPVQHFWSLAVEEQFYVAWPLMIAAVVGATAARRREVPRRALTQVLLLIIALSLAWSVHATATSATTAYFSTFTRAWQLALGALLAVTASRVAAQPRAARSVASLIGLTAVIVAALVYDEGTAYPGVAAALPTLGAAMLLVGGMGSPTFVSTVLSARPLRFLGDISYSLYLWHWPVLIIAAEYRGDLSGLARAGLVVGSVLLATLTYYAIENPIRRSRAFSRDKANALLLWPATAAACLVLVLWGTNQATAEGNQRLAAAAQAQADLERRGATQQPAAVDPALTPEQDIVAQSVRAARSAAPIPAALRPSLDAIRDDRAKGFGKCNSSAGTTRSAEVCSLGDTGAGRSVAIVGNSHAGHWLPTLLAAAEEHNFAVHPLTKDGCHAENYTDVDTRSECLEWFQWAVEQVGALKPDILIFSPDYSPGYSAGTPKALAALKAAGPGRLLLLGDVPGVKERPEQCLLRPGATLATCSTPHGALERDRQAAALATAAGVEFQQTSDWFCFERLCPTVIGDMIAYTDTNHLSATYGRHLSQAFTQRLQLAVR